jgi:xanthine dehydrogenase accessory factor
LMPSYAAELSETQLAELVREVDARRSASAAPGSPDEPARLVTDPVCHMTVRVGPDTPLATDHGREVYFCSDRCRDSFVANPFKFTKSAVSPP